MSRFRDADADTIAIVNRVRQESFPQLQGAEIKVIFDTKKRMSKGKLVLGRMKKTNEVERFLSANQTGTEEGFDYIMYLDELAWDIANDDERVKLARHELRHCDVDIDSNTNPYKIKGHDIEDFEEEIRLNQDDPGWGNRLAERTQLEYESEAEQNRRNR